MSKPLNTRQKKFVENYAIKGMSIAESVRRAGYCISTGRVEDASSYGCKLLRQDRVKTYLAKIREKQFTREALTFAEKRAFLARAVRADASNPDADLVQEVREEVDSEGNVKRMRKMVSKLEALNIDNKMCGDEYRDRQPQASNPFLFIVSLGKAGQPGEIAGASVAGVPGLPGGSTGLPGRAVSAGDLVEAEAEIVQD